MKEKRFLIGNRLSDRSRLLFFKNSNLDAIYSGAILYSFMRTGSSQWITG